MRAIQAGVALLVILVILVIAGVTAYGLRLAAQFVAAQAALVRQRGDMKLVFDNVAQGLSRAAPQQTSCDSSWASISSPRT